jgi:hypothetical protein
LDFTAASGSRPGFEIRLVMQEGKRKMQISKFKELNILSGVPEVSPGA